TSNWNDQKVHVTGYTQPSNQYFATRARLAYHPPDKTFGSFSSSTMNVQGVELKPQTQAPPPPASKPDAALPKETQPSSSSKSKQESLEEYEADYLKRLEDAKIADEKAYQEAVEEETKHRASTTHGSLPKGFSSAAPEPEKPKASKGTLPKGF
ncbi:MAG: trans-sialidase, partial [Nitrosopumilus sp. H13]